MNKHVLSLTADQYQEACLDHMGNVLREEIDQEILDKIAPGHKLPHDERRLWFTPEQMDWALDNQVQVKFDEHGGTLHMSFECADHATEFALRWL